MKPPADPRHTLTLRDVSEASGVSEMTVSRVLRNRGDVSAATREKVLEAARTLGYVPNKIAGALASQRVNLVGVVIPSLSNMVFPEVMTGISEVLDGTGLQPVVGVTNYLPDREEAVIYEMLSWRPSGMIIAGLEHTDAARAMLGRAGIPIVEIMDIDGDAGEPRRRASRTAAPGGRWPRRSSPRATAASPFWARRCRTTSAPRSGLRGSKRRWPRPGCRWSTVNSIPAARPF